MKLIKIAIPIFLILFTLSSCQDDDSEFGEIVAPSNLVVDFQLQGVDAANPFGDGSGKVNFTASAENVLNFTYDFGDNRTSSVYDGIAEHQFVELGTNVYNVTVTASGTGGASTTQTILVEVLSTFDDAEAKELLTGNSSKTWYWAADERAHLGVGPNLANSSDTDNSNPIYYAAGAFEKECPPSSSCFYMDELIFTLNGNNVQYELMNMGATYFNAAFLSVAGGSGSNDDCLAFDTSGVKNVAFLPSLTLVADADKRGTTLQFSDSGFMSYYIGTSTYDIIELTPDRMVVRGLQGSDLAWYHTFTTTRPVNPIPCI